MGTTRHYDDGSLEIPSGVQGPVERVLIVGAGMAGLTVANALTHAGVECVVLEARDRIGGRLQTVDLGGSPVDLGGSWIHTPIGNPMTAWAAQNGVDQRPAHWLEAAAGWDRDGGPVDDDTFEWMLDQVEGGVRIALADVQTTVDAATSPTEWISGYVEDLGLDAARARQLRWILRVVAEADASGSLEERSLAWLYRYGIEYDGDGVGDLPVGGYRRLLAPMAAGLDVRLGSVVRRIEFDKGGVRIKTADGATHPGSHVVVTVPVGVLKAGSIEFEPALPVRHLAAIERLGFGRFEKVAIRFSDTAWLPVGLPNTFVLADPQRPDLPIIVSLDAFVGEPVVVALAPGSTAHLVTDGTLDDAVASLLAVIEQVTGVRPPAPVAATRTDWARDPYALGAYSYVAVGGTPDDFDALGQPVDGRLLFAGEATSQRRTGYADGAMSSGIREAKRLLGLQEVRLGAT